MEKAPGGAFSRRKQGGSPRPEYAMGWEGFGCQVHRPHAADDSSVDQGRGWSQSVGLAALTIWVSEEQAGAVREPAWLHGDPLFSTR